MFLPALVGLGNEEFIILFVVFCLFILLAFSRSTRVIVVSSKTINPKGPLLVRIQGRRAGVISWLMKRCRIETAITLSVYKDRIELDEDSFFGQKTNFILLKNVSALEVSYASSALLLALTVILFFFGLIFSCMAESFLPFFIFLLISVFTFVGYILSKSYGIQVRTPGFSCRLLLQRSLIEGETLNPYDQEALRQIFRFLMDPEHNEIKLEEITPAAQFPQVPATAGSAGVETKGAAARVFSPIIPPPPAPPAPPVPPVPPVPPAPPRNPSRFR